MVYIWVFIRGNSFVGECGCGCGFVVVIVVFIVVVIVIMSLCPLPCQPFLVDLSHLLQRHEVGAL